MLKTNFIFLALITTLLAVSCAPVAATAPTPTPFLPAPSESAPVQGVAVIQSVQVQLLENSPLQVNAIVRGQLPDTGCTTIAAVDQVRDGNTFKLTLTTTTDPLALCALALTPFEHVIALDVSSLPPAKYTVNANGIAQSFELMTRDLTKFKQGLVEALNARNYDLLRLQMDKSLMIALWRSQGSAYEAEPAVEQLKLNHLSTSTPITADLNKDLTTLPDGTDPLSIFGLDVGPNFALFVSGWGLDGKDEAILYVNYLLDGSMYWHGVLVAKGGFAPSNNGSDQPVDMNAYPTHVKYVLAQRDVTIYTGPGNHFGIIGSVFSGQIAQVTGTNSNGSWWRIICPDNIVGSCWVSADPSLTQPTTGPHTNQPLPPGDVQPTNVQFVIAQQDVSIYGGPTTQYTIIGMLAAGQTAKVTGISADGNWWRVICPDDTVGSCWVSANSNFTKPSDGLGNNPPSGDSVQPTNVQYVMAQRDINLYSGAGTQSSVIGSLASGQTAKPACL